MMVKEVMKRDFHSISPDAKLLDAARMMDAYGVDTLPVIEDGRLVGVIGVRDLFTAPVVAYSGVEMPKNRDLQQLPMIWKDTIVRMLMNDNVMSISGDTNLNNSAKLMINYGKHMLPVVSGDKVVGTIDRMGILQWILNME